MYQTNITNSINNAAKAHSLVPFQKDLWENEGHNRDHLIVDQVFDYYHLRLKSQFELSEMLTLRKIHPKLIDKFKIGFADRTLGFELQSPKCLLGSQNRGHLQRLGLLKDSGHEFFRGSLVIPYQDRNGHIVGAYGRRPRHQRRNQTYHLYWNTQQVDFFNATRLPQPDSLILCKSALDVLTLLSAGIENTVATMGMKGFNDIQLSRLVEDRVRRVCIAFDNTPEANRYALLIAQALDAVNISCYRLKLPVGHDVNRFAMQQKDTAGVFNRLLDAAAPFKQRYGQLVPQAEAHWLKQLISIQNCVAFYLEEQRHGGKASRTLNTARIHLERFRDYCHSHGIEQIADINSAALEAYQKYLVWEKNVFTGKVISLTTQMERMDSVARMLSRLHYYGIMPEPLAFITPNGTVH